MSDMRKVHLADQIGAGLRLNAKMLGEYRAELVAQGLPEVEIRLLVIQAAGVLLPGKAVQLFDETDPQP